MTAVAPTALAQAPPANADTYAAILRHGVVIETADLEIDVHFNSDGTFRALGGLSKGVWKIVGDKLCSTPDETLIETCAAYPPGKKSGDRFELDAPGGRVPVRIP
jgi:transcription elongation GreA/GreB family factor